MITELFFLMNHETKIFIFCFNISKKMKLIICLIIFVNFVNSKNYSYDLIVFGATPSGIMAAVEASRHSVTKIAIVAPEPHIGGKN